jgi:hypothetical protein
MCAPCSSLPKKAVQDLGCILIPQQTRDYGPSYAKTGYLVVTLKDQKGGVPVRIEAVEGSESDAGENYFIIAKVLFFSPRSVTASLPLCEMMPCDSTVVWTRRAT